MEDQYLPANLIFGVSMIRLECKRNLSLRASSLIKVSRSLNYFPIQPLIVLIFSLFEKPKHVMMISGSEVYEVLKQKRNFAALIPKNDKQKHTFFEASSLPRSLYDSIFTSISVFWNWN